METLPSRPGLARRLAYGEMLRIRYRRFHDRPFQHIPIDVYGTVISSMTTPQTSHKHVFESTTVSICKKQDVCVVCQETTTPLVDVVRELHCKHTFHIHCIDRWLCESACCPLCKDTLRMPANN